MRNWPLKWRVSLLVGLILLSTIVIVSIVAYVELEEALLRNMDPTLKLMAEGVLDMLHEGGPGEELRAKSCSVTNYTGGPHSTRFRVWMDNRDGDLFASDPPTSPSGQLLSNLPESERPAIGEFVFLDLNQGEYEYRAIWTRCAFQDRVANLLVASSSHYAFHEMSEFLRLLLVLGGSLLLGTFLLVPLLVDWGLRPIGLLASVLRKITYKNVGEEYLKTEKVSRELLPFVEALGGMLARLDKAIKQQKQFIADASHELRTPLAVIKSTIQTARITDRNTAEYVAALDEIHEDVRRMEILTNQLLSLARMEDAPDFPDSTPVSLDSMLRGLVEVFDARIVQQGGKVILEDAPTARVEGNENELSQLFTNILDNAVKYGPPGGTVTVSLSRDAQGYAVVRIHDAGGAIPSEALGRLFDRFYRVESSRSRATGGSGLGLAIAKEIVQRHKGQIEITSNLDEGTSVWVRLPLS